MLYQKVENSNVLVVVERAEVRVPRAFQQIYVLRRNIWQATRPIKLAMVVHLSGFSSARCWHTINSRISAQCGEK